MKFNSNKFHKTASFSNATFQQVPSFSLTTFHAELNMINCLLPYDFQDIQRTINDSALIAIVKKHELANDYRDSFRLLKSVLLKGNNLFEASTYHRSELYCKEIELDGKPDSEKSLRDKVDQCVLAFYRYASDHHTDLLKILSWIIVAIGMFGTALFAMQYGFDLQGYLKSLFPCLVGIKQIEDCQIYLMGVFYILMFISLPFWLLKALLIFRVRVVCKISQMLLPIKTLMQSEKTFCRFLQSCCRIYNILRLCISLFVVIAMIYTQPKYILGIGSLFGANRSGWENLLIVTYSIIMFLLLFSLQKTARKNSIVVT